MGAGRKGEGVVGGGSEEMVGFDDDRLEPLDFGKRFRGFGISLPW